MRRAGGEPPWPQTPVAVAPWLMGKELYQVARFSIFVPQQLPR